MIKYITLGLLLILNSATFAEIISSKTLDVDSVYENKDILRHLKTISVDKKSKFYEKAMKLDLGQSGDLFEQVEDYLLNNEKAGILVSQGHSSGLAFTTNAIPVYFIHRGHMEISAWLFISQNFDFDNDKTQVTFRIADKFSEYME